MTLLISSLAASIFTIAWYINKSEHKMYLAVPCFMLWGASIMWLVDAIVEYIELGAEYFSPAPEDMLNDLFLGLTVVVITFVVWVAVTLIKDPKGIWRKNK